MTDSGGAIIIAGLVTTGTTLVKEVSAGKVTVKPVLAGFVLTGALLIISVFASDLARGLAILTMVTAVLLNGTDLFKLLGRIGG